jgi:hypothetical protein
MVIHNRCRNDFTLSTTACTGTAVASIFTPAAATPGSVISWATRTGISSELSSASKASSLSRPRSSTSSSTGAPKPATSTLRASTA